MSEERLCYGCNGVLSLMGTLGNYIWYRCVQCGMEQAYKVGDVGASEIIDLDTREDEDGEWRQIE